MNAGLVPAEVRTLVATYTAFIGLDLDAMHEGVGLLRAELDLSPREVAKVRYLLLVRAQCGQRLVVVHVDPIRARHRQVSVLMGAPRSLGLSLTSLVPSLPVGWLDEITGR